MNDSLSMIQIIPVSQAVGNRAACGDLNFKLFAELSFSFENTWEATQGMLCGDGFVGFVHPDPGCSIINFKKNNRKKIHRIGGLVHPEMVTSSIFKDIDDDQRIASDSNFEGMSLDCLCPLKIP